MLHFSLTPVRRSRIKWLTVPFTHLYDTLAIKGSPTRHASETVSSTDQLRYPSFHESTIEPATIINAGYPTFATFRLATLCNQLHYVCCKVNGHFLERAPWPVVVRSVSSKGNLEMSQDVDLTLRTIAESGRKGETISWWNPEIACR